MSDEITGTGKSVSITDGSRQLDLACQCGSKIFHVIVVLLAIRPGAAITKLQCFQCRNVFVVSDEGVVGEKRTLYKDAQNRNHHVMKAEPGIFRR